jgi:hypothetical protein
MLEPTAMTKLQNEKHNRWGLGGRMFDFGFPRLGSRKKEGEEPLIQWGKNSSLMEALYW